MNVKTPRRVQHGMKKQFTRERRQEKLIDEILLQHAFMVSPSVEATAPGICTVQFTDNLQLIAKVSRVLAKLA
jgi:hypothetical protein